MAGIRTLIALTNGASAPLRDINKNMNALVVASQRVERASKNMFQPSEMVYAQEQVQIIDTEYKEVADSIQKAGKKQKEFEENVKNTSVQADNLYNKVKRLVGAYVGIRGAGMTLNMSDNLTETRARLDIMNDGLQTTEQLEQKIMQSANRARQKFTDTAKVIGKLGITASSAFKNNDEIIAFSELMSKSFKLGGASASEQANGMYQLTQAMASGRLQGDEFRSIIENAPLLAQAIGKATGKGMAELKKMSSEGEITADIIKSALFQSADEIEEKYKKMPITFHDVWNRIQNTAIEGFRPFFDELSQIIQTQEIYKFTDGLIASLSTVGIVAAKVIGMLTKGAGFIYDHWDKLQYLFWALVAVFTVYTVVTTAQTAATWALATAQWVLNSAILTCPLFWIVAGIAVVIASLLVWANKIIGIRAVWLKTINFILTLWDSTVIGAYATAYLVCNAWDNITIGVRRAGTGILNALGTTKANGLMIIQNFVNGAISMINKLISFVNKIPGVSIATIQQVTFGAEAVAKNNAEVARRNVETNSYVTAKQSNIQRRNDKLVLRARVAEAKRMERVTGINSAIAEHKAGKKRSTAENVANYNYSKYANNDVFNNVADNTKGTRDNTGKMRDSLERTEEDLKYMRDIAEREVIDRTVLRDVTVKVDNSFGDIHETADIDGIIRKIEKQLNDEFETEPEGAA